MNMFRYSERSDILAQLLLALGWAFVGYFALDLAAVISKNWHWWYELVLWVTWLFAAGFLQSSLVIHRLEGMVHDAMNGKWSRHI